MVIDGKRLADSAIDFVFWAVGVPVCFILLWLAFQGIVFLYGLFEAGFDWVEARFLYEHWLFQVGFHTAWLPEPNSRDGAVLLGVIAGLIAALRRYIRSGRAQSAVRRD